MIEAEPRGGVVGSGAGAGVGDRLYLRFSIIKYSWTCHLDSFEEATLTWTC